MHGSVDWFDKGYFIERQRDAQDHGYPSYVPSDPVFNSRGAYTLSPLVQGSRFADDPLREVYRLKEIEQFYNDPPWFMATPVIINPSTMKLIYSETFGQFWYGMHFFGAANLRLSIIGYSLPYHDDYARQALYRIVRNYQMIPVERVRPWRARKEQLMIVDFKNNEDDVAELKDRYSFVDWDRTALFLDGFDEGFVRRLC
jgi:hypothetical protein